MSGGEGAGGRARYILSTVAIVASALVFPPSLIPAGFAIFVFDTPDMGWHHEFYILVTFVVLLFMPVIAVLGIVVPWRARKRGRHRLEAVWSAGTLAVIAYWWFCAWVFYFT